MKLRICGLLAIATLTVMAPGQSRAANLTTLVSFCSLANCADGEGPFAGLLADANGNLFGTTEVGGAYGDGTVFEIAKTATGYASAPTIPVSFCSLANCADGAPPVAGLTADANGNLFGTTYYGGAYAGGTVFEITGSGFVPATVASAPPSGSLCNGAYDGTFHGNVTVSAGQECIFLNGGQITGNVTMVGGIFALNDASVVGSVTINGGGTYTFGPAATVVGNLIIQNIPPGSASNSVCGTTVNGSMQFDNNGIAVQIGSTEPFFCTGDTIGGNFDPSSTVRKCKQLINLGKICFSLVCSAKG